MPAPAPPATSGSATPPGAVDDDSVEALLRRGIALRREGHDAEALALFQRAYLRAHSATAAAQLALAEQALGRWLDAERHLGEALATTDDPWITRNRAALEAAFGTIRENIGTLDVLGGVPGASVRIDGREVGALPLREPLRLEAGAVTLEVIAQGFYPATRRVGIIGGQPTRETITLRPRLPGDTGSGPRIVYRHERETGWLVAGSVVLTVFYLPALIAGVAGMGGCNSTSDATCRLIWFTVPVAGPLGWIIHDSFAANQDAGARAVEWTLVVLGSGIQFAGIAMVYVGLQGRRVPVVENAPSPSGRASRTGTTPRSGWLLAPRLGTDGAGLTLSGWF